MIITKLSMVAVPVAPDKGLGKRVVVGRGALPGVLNLPSTPENCEDPKAKWQNTAPYLRG